MNIMASQTIENLIFSQQLVQAYNKENIKARHNCKTSLKSKV